MLEDETNAVPAQESGSERIVWRGRPSQVVNLGAFVLYGGAALALFVLALLTRFWWHLHWAVAAVLAVGGLVSAMVCLWKALVVSLTSYELTSERLLLHRGVFNRTSDQLELYRVKDYRLEKPLLLRLFGLSNLILLTSDKTSPQLVIPAIRDGDKLFKTIRDAVERLRQHKRVREIDFD